MPSVYTCHMPCVSICLLKLWLDMSCAGIWLVSAHVRLRIQRVIAHVMCRGKSCLRIPCLSHIHSNIRTHNICTHYICTCNTYNIYMLYIYYIYMSCACIIRLSAHVVCICYMCICCVRAYNACALFGVCKCCVHMLCRMFA